MNTIHKKNPLIHKIIPCILLCIIGVFITLTPINAYAGDPNTAQISGQSVQENAANSIQNITNGSGIQAIEANSYTYGFVKSFTSTMISYAQNAYNQFSSPMSTALTYVFAIWFCYKCIALCFGLEQTQNIIWDMAKKCAVFFLLYSIILSQHSINYWDMFINYPLNTTARISQSIMSAAGGSALPSCDLQDGTENISNLPQQMGCLSALIERGPHIGIVLGMLIISGTDVVGNVLSFHFTELVAVLLNLFSGGFIYLLYLMNMVAFTFMILDLVLKIAIISSLAPIFIGCYFLPITRSYAKNALSQLIGAYIQIVSCCFTVAISTSLLASIAGNVANKLNASGIKVAGNNTDAIEAWKNIINASSASGTIGANPKISAALSIYSSNYWAIFAIGIFMVAFAKKIHGILSGIFSATNFSGMSDMFMPIISNAAVGGAELGMKGIMVGGRKGSVIIRNSEAYNSGKIMAKDMYNKGKSSAHASAGAAMNRASEGLNHIPVIRKTREFLNGGNPPKPANPFHNTTGSSTPNNTNNGQYNNPFGSQNNGNSNTPPPNNNTTPPNNAPPPPPNNPPSSPSTPPAPSTNYHNPLNPNNNNNNPPDNNGGS